MFQKIKSILYKIAFVILFLVAAKSCISDYVKGPDKIKISQYEQMLSDDSFVYADLDEHFTQTTIGRSKTTVNYTFDYTFELNEKKYSGKISIRELPNSPVLKLYYLKSDPNIVSYNPKKSIENENKKGQSISDLLVGILWSILAVLFLISLLSEIKTHTKKNINVEVLEKKSYSKRCETEEVEQILSQEEKTEKKEKENHERFMPK